MSFSLAYFSNTYSNDTETVSVTEASALSVPFMQHSDCAFAAT